jgi:hypothetical protein
MKTILKIKEEEPLEAEKAFAEKMAASGEASSPAAFLENYEEAKKEAL